MAATTTISIAVTLTAKTVVVTGLMAIRETVAIILTGTGAAGGTDLRLGLVGIVDGEKTLLAFSDDLVTDGDHIDGTLDLNTEEMVDFFDGHRPEKIQVVTLAIWDITNQQLLVNAPINVKNNPYDDSMADPTPVEPIAGVEYAPIANGVTNGDAHLHQAGDGGDLTPYLMARTPTGGFFKQSSDNLDIMLKDRLTGDWRPLILYNGALSVGPAE